MTQSTLITPSFSDAKIQRTLAEPQNVCSFLPTSVHCASTWQILL